MPERRHRINERIRVPRVRLVDVDGRQIGVVRLEEALEKAKELELDLVEVAPKADPPVCRLMDYGKYIYRLAKEQRQRQHHTQLKEVKFRPKIDSHDFEFKRNHIERFLSEGHQVKATVMFRGREVVHPELGERLLQRVIDELGDRCRVEKPPTMEGRQMVMILTPRRE